MNKKWIFGASAAVLSVSLLANAAFASGVLKVTADIVPFSWKIGDQTYTSEAGYNDGSTQLPTSLNYQGTTYIPIRLLAETMGYDVEWDGDSRTATIEDGDNEDPIADLPGESAERPKQILSNPATLASNVNLMTSPDDNSTVAATLPVGTKVNVLAEAGPDKLQVSSNGQTGYIPSASTDYRSEADRAAWEQKADAIIAMGLTYLGTPYKFGAKTGQTNTFDCSSFTKFLFAKQGITLPRVSRDQSKHGIDVPLDQLRKGDLVFFTTPGRKNKTGLDHIGHVAIYMGDGQLLHTFRVGIGVTVTKLDKGWKSRMVSAKRILD
jgi:cell wall-associated NlpC family hydrolase